MKTKFYLLVVGMFLVATSSALATVHYVNIANTHPTAPYTNWVTAATNIQNAVDAAVAGDEIIVTNGTYAPVTVNTQQTLQSVNGPDVTLIDGGGGTECLYLATNAVMVGFTLTNGYGGVYCESTNAVLTNCVLTGNQGGGAYGGTLNNCTLTGNSAYGFGGGASFCTLNNCTLAGNLATGTYFWGQTFGGGGGAYSCTLNNCTLTGNSATGNGVAGGGAYSCTLDNCTLTGNSAPDGDGGGACSCTLNNCIVYFNSDRNGGNYDPYSMLNYCCATPMPTNGVGNISDDPQLASASHLSALSPCIGAGSATYASGTDIDGEVWNNPPSIGCDEYHAGAVTGSLTVAISADYTNVATGFPVGLTAFIAGRTDLSVWDFGDGFVEVNEPYTLHIWKAPGDYLVSLWTFNDTYPEGVRATVMVHIVEGVYYVAASNGNSAAPYTSWATAATNIQDAVDAAGAGGTVFVTNGTYAMGGEWDANFNFDLVIVDKPLRMQSVNGPGVTVIDAGGSATCVYLTNNVVLVGFTLTNGSGGWGGGVYCESTRAVLTNCVLTGNSYCGAYGGTLNCCVLTGNSGDGADYCTLNDCTVTSNSAAGAGGSTLNNCVVSGNLGCGAYGYYGYSGYSYTPCTLNNCAVSGNTGGGANGGTLNNCTIVGNSGWGASSATLNNCIIYFNLDPNGGNCDSYSTLSYCCTTPLPTNGVGNIGTDPQLASASHLGVASPCIRAGSPAYASGTDIDGEAWANPPSIGCDEYHAGAVTGPLTVSLTATYTNVATGFPVSFTAFIEGCTDLSVWDFGDGTVVSNRPYASHAWPARGDYQVTLRAYNDSHATGVAASVMIHVIVPPVFYVALNNTSSVPPYGSWAFAATNIQEAVDATSVPGTVVLVTNGTYGPVTVYTPLTLQSVNGPGVTIINGGGTQRCVNLTSDSVMVGFTLTNGIGGVSCESTSAVLTNCILTGNSYCGACGGTLNRCVLTGNLGDGADFCTLNNCTITGNSASGAGYSTLNNCVVSGNLGGGAYGYYDGDSHGLCTLNNCTVTGNSGWGASLATMNNCVVYFNSDANGGNYDPSSTLNYCCATPVPLSGVGNIGDDPQLASASHLSAESPCIGAGSATYVSGTDIDGEVWNNPPSIGCDEYHAGAVTGPLTVSLTATLTNSVRGYPVGLTALIHGRTDLSVWDFGDGFVEVNKPYTSHAWTALGDYHVALWAFNDSYPEGVSATVTVHVEEGLHYVSASSGNPVAPYTSWATAARSIQEAVDVAPPGATIFVTNGTYAGGSRVDPYWGSPTRVVVDKPLTVQSVNGPGATLIDGGAAVTCVYLTSDTVLVGFTLTRGVRGVSSRSASAVLTNCVLTGNSTWEGGGAYNCTLDNCTLAGNSATWGGGACGCTLNNCTLTSNSAVSKDPYSTGSGGGAYGCTLNNCTLTGNSASEGGGAYWCTLNNCIVYFNGSGNIASYSSLNYCCTTPMQDNGIGNITNAPMFVNYAGGNLRLQFNSPCINSGNNVYVVASTDLDGNPRIVGGTVDIGAYEYQTPVSMISYAWLQQYGLPITSNTDAADTDCTGMCNWQKWIAGLNPTNALSVLKMLAPARANYLAGMVVTWQSVNTRSYYLQRSTNLVAQPAFTTIQSNLVGQAGTTSYTDTTATNAGPFFYRVGVGN